MKRRCSPTARRRRSRPIRSSRAGCPPRRRQAAHEPRTAEDRVVKPELQEVSGVPRDREDELQDARGRRGAPRHRHRLRASRTIPRILRALGAGADGRRGTHARDRRSTPPRAAAPNGSAQTDLGTLEASKWADFVVLDADPLADIRNTRRIRVGVHRRTIGPDDHSTRELN